MATNFPSSLDNLSNPTGSSALTSPDHAGQHADANDAIEALEAKVGVDGSAVTTSFDYKISNGVFPKLNVDSGVLFVDATNNRVGVNNSSPTVALDVTGAEKISGDLTVATTAFTVNSTTGKVGVGTASPSSTLDVIGSISARTSPTQDGVALSGRTGGTGTYEVTLTPTTLTADRTLTLPDATGTVALNSGANADYVSPYTGFRNAIINGDFRINQRAFTSATASGSYGHDRWLFGGSGGTVTYSTQAFTVGSPAVTGYESQNFARLVTSGQTGAASDYAWLSQPIEDVRTFANSTITISFWAKASSGTPKVAVSITQVFGSGGSPSAAIDTYGSQVTLSTSWARYSVTMAVPNINGKTIGSTANTSYLQLLLWTSAGSTYSARTGTLGVQNATIDFWGVQVERGSVATPFEQRPIQTELALCQRYYYQLVRGSAITLGIGFYNFTSQVYFTVTFPVTMRITPILVSSTGTNYYQASYGFTADQFNSLTLHQASPQTAGLYNGSEASGTAYQAFFMQTNDASAAIAFNSEF